MQVTVSKKEILRLLARCQSVADKRSTMPVLGNVLLTTEGDSRLRLSATNLNVGLSGAIPAQVGQAGLAAIGARDLFERVKMMPDGNISLTTDDNASAILKAAEQPRRYTLHGLAGDDFPQLPQPDEASHSLTLEIDTLAQLIASTHFSVSTDETRIHLNSALLEWSGDVVRMVTTDGHRLSKMEVTTSGTGETSMLIPLKGIQELRRLCDEARAEGQKDVVVRHNETNAFFDLAGVQFSVKLVDAQFPPYDQVIPESTTNSIRAPRAAVADALKAVSLAASDRTGGVKLTLGENVVRFSSESPDTGDGFDEVAVEYAGDSFTIGFNAKYFLDVLGAIESEDLLLGISGELDPALICPAEQREGTNYLAVIMPMRI